MKNFFWHLGIALAIAILVSLSFYAGLFRGLELFLEDVLVSPKLVNPEIAVVAIDNESIQKIGQWPWPREIFAKTFQKLNVNPPQAVGFDVMLSESSRLGNTDDQKLAAALKISRYPITFPVEVENSGRSLRPLQIFLDNPNVSVGHVNLILDADSVARRFAPYQKVMDVVSPAFALNVLKYKNQLSNEEKIVYAAPPGTIRKIPFWRILEDDKTLASLKNKLVFIGATAPDLHDEQATPISRGVLMPGVEIHAQIANMYLNGYRLREVNRLIMVALILAAALISANLFIIFHQQASLPLWSNLGMGILYTGAVALLFGRGLIINFLHLHFSWLMTTVSLFSYRFLILDKEKRQIRNLFSKYVSQDVLRELLKNPEAVQLGGEEKEVTVLFSDIRSFTTLSEKTTPKELVRILNQYFTAMTGEILKNKGVLDKYIGDAIMAFWGAPLPNPKHAENALQTSLAMLKKLKELNEEFRSAGDPEIKIGIGLYTGRVVVGNMGSEQRFDYTVMGDAVNVASRLEGLNKEYKTEIILGETTRNQIRNNYPFQGLGEVSVKGRNQSVKIFTI